MGPIPENSTKIHASQYHIPMHVCEPRGNPLAQHDMESTALEDGVLLKAQAHQSDILVRSKEAEQFGGGKCRIFREASLRTAGNGCRHWFMGKWARACGSCGPHDMLHALAHFQRSTCCYFSIAQLDPLELHDHEKDIIELTFTKPTCREALCQALLLALCQ